MIISSFFGSGVSGWKKPCDLGKMKQSCIGLATDPFNVSGYYCCSHQQEECNGVRSHCQMRVQVGFLVGHACGLRCFCPVWVPGFLPDHVLYCWQKSLKKTTKNCMSNVCMINWSPPPLIACECWIKKQYSVYGWQCLVSKGNNLRLFSC